ncbi:MULTISPECIES: helix-turn-helix transcriptional regulator [Enterobacter cloacae complex]|uniref:helix-turn-helix transcriptional regulator n=1 Tax=Enterobacter cloacae complex TaxID=354276 RepID=UPI00057919E6|nr:MULTISPECIES: AlpA family transcriptional regulator [Enterobacter cloacae complex]ELE9736995.1 AlpA family transcriptional regulator [Enterobacter kobei]MBG0697061.1 AlpA family transcriptional regulator [Enterobacter roggenkampii]MBK4668701.1 AlpA family transcriptional regulator [Enterobacter hormaechei]MCE1981279.1 AlpA family transcriptional regulator [Enterobacter kobei]MCK6969171.1 AlpA family transcriptional regulator [Enterobacter kobei]
MHTTLSVPASRSGAHSTPVSAQTQERFLRLPEVIHQCGLSRSTLYDLIARDAFPAQVSLGGKNVAWLQSEVTAWMAERIAHRNRKYDA